MNRSALAVDAVLPEVVAGLRRHSALVVRAPTGAGKTTRIPPALFDAGFAAHGKILLLEPRRLAARAAARRMTEERGGQLGEEIGYHVRFDRQSGRQTKIVVVTPGILLRQMLDEPYLESISTIIFDEFHERSMENDLALGLARLVQQTVRPELRVVVMSATLAAEKVATYLGHCPVIVAEGRQYPVEVRYEPKPADRPWPLAVADATARLLDRTSGDLLVFLPGIREIRQTAKHLAPLAESADLLIVPLHGDLPANQQDAALLPQNRRKVVLATNVAETSVTVEGISGVVDSGLARQLSFDAGVGLDRLRLMPISKASADQRTGRAGRTQPGVCVRLWSAAAHLSRPDETEPEVRRVDLAGALLHLLCLGETELLRFPWLEPPPDASVEQAKTLLRRLGAVDDHGVTELGRLLARLPVHPRVSRLLVEGLRWGHPDRVALAAALLSERDVFPRNLDRPDVNRPRASTPSDVLDRVEAMEAWERRGVTSSPLGTLHRDSARFVLLARDQLLQLLRHERRLLAATRLVSSEEALLRSLLAAYPDRVARRREAGSRRGVRVGVRGVYLAASSGVLEPELFLGIDVDAGQAETLVRQASTIERDWLPSGQVRSVTDIAFDAETEKVIARKRLLYEDLVLEESPAALPESAEIGRILATAAWERWDRVFPAPESPARQYLTRLQCLREWMPELKLPAFGDSDLRELLTWLCHDLRSFADLRQADWLGAIQGRLTFAQRQSVDQESPERLQVPSGSRIAVRYERGRPPVLAVRIQEVFGLRETPRIAGGRVPVLLHLLAPSFRPQQVTDDLASFWKNIYPQIRKELRARYPKHAWPEDPLTSPAQRGPRRKR